MRPQWPSPRKALACNDFAWASPYEVALSEVLSSYGLAPDLYVYQRGLSSEELVTHPSLVPSGFLAHYPSSHRYLTFL